MPGVSRLPQLLGGEETTYYMVMDLAPLMAYEVPGDTTCKGRKLVSHGMNFDQ